MPKLQFERPAAERQSTKLMSKANPKNRHASQELSNIFHGVSNRLRVTWTVREEHAIRLQRQDVFSGSPRGYDGNFAIVIHKKPQNVLLDSEIVGHHSMPRRFFGARSRPATPRSRARSTNAAGGGLPCRRCTRRSRHRNRRRQINRALIPHIRLRRRHPPRQFLASHGRQRARFGDQLFGSSAVGRYDATQCPYFAQMPHERAGIEIPDDRNAVSFQILLRRFARAPIRSQQRKLAHHESFDIRLRRLFIIQIRADVPDMRIGEADNLTGIAGIGENFLVTREAGVENNFSAAARASAGRAAVKYSSVFQREYRATCGLLRQCGLQKISSRCRIYRGRISERAEMVHGPVGKNRFAVDIRPAHRTKNP